MLTDAPPRKASRGGFMESDRVKVEAVRVSVFTPRFAQLASERTPCDRRQESLPLRLDASERPSAHDCKIRRVRHADLKMPNMSGFEFLSIVRRRFPQIPTIAISGEFHPPLDPLGVLADAFFEKPLRFEELLAKITELLHDAPPRPATKKDKAPAWVPRNGEYYVITCTDCLRSFSIPAEKDVRERREVRTLECIFCNAQVQFIVEEKLEASGLPMIKKQRTA
jgi:hypothetical protein